MLVSAIIGMGIPGCGKTTILKPMAAERGMVYVSRDDIREELTGDPTNHTREKAVNRLMFERIADALHGGQGVVIDMTHSRVKDRRTSIDFCREHGAQFIKGIWFDVPIEICRKRNSDRDRVVREEALFAMAHRFKVNPPSVDEGFDEILRFSE